MKFKLINESIVASIGNAGAIEMSCTLDNPEYIQWLAEGNTPEPADVPDPKLAIASQISQLESAQLLPRVTREFMLQFTEASFTPEQLANNFGYQKLKEFDALVASLRAQL